ncbi:phosphoribosylaminoimidazolesuccinocarboxamide synthase [Jiangella ureilytica]|uniref:Phosphoribosylaminoimidazole-succinocarboxamide synthase n=1 Tax=Jiangella ureilytica TaxID=2530374 RepID=A0A4V2XXU4_9ACTN|nr:phosphoribosylaminoimidazolesuccinocarboxamide synthase [Jiangella ureilytica]TDC54615.1 phosphoribosylaminoimidazolesuccinocarboxamide synthase [Jiangella ureilytica]
MQLLHKGKVRDVYSDRPGELILVASDRVSVYDVVLPTPVPDKGKVLTALSLWWFEQLADVVPNHVISAEDVPDEWRGRAIRCKQVEIVPVECVARGYLAGSGWTSYQQTGTVSGVSLPEGLLEGSRLPEPIFTPTTKTPPELGHDEPMTYDEVVALAGAPTASALRGTTLTVYRRAAELMEQRGVLLVDTKLEFGLDADGGLVLADEVLTPDSSRFWQAAQWAPGGRQVSYDKQVVRDWAQDLGTWDKTPPGPAIPDDVVERTRTVYIEMYERITGHPWS